MMMHIPMCITSAYYSSQAKPLANGIGASVADRRGEEATSDQPCQLGPDWWMGIHAALLEI